MGSKNKVNNNNNQRKSINGGDSGGQEKRKLIDDPRFSKVHYDPVFQNVPKNKSKVKIDCRFRSVFTDKKFATASTARVDKRGRVKKQSENDLRRYYSDEDEEMTKTKKKNRKNKLLKDKVEGEDEEEEQNIGDESSESASEELSKSESESSDTTTSSDDTDDDVDGADMSGDDASVEVENVPVIEKETHRLAVVNMDWSQVKAVDLFVMLSSCLPKGGQIKSVAVYPSEFGLKRMEEEALRGPVALFEDEKKKDEGDSDEGEGYSDEDEGDNDEGADNDDEVSANEEDANEVSDNEEDVGEVGGNEGVDEDDEYEEMYCEDADGDDFEDDGDNDDDDDVDDDDDQDEDHDKIDNEKLRAYEKSRLRYYYAVVECDSIATADCLYKACDGLEFERSSNVLDLRFIPDSMEFNHQPRDVATEAPTEYEGLDFHTRALQQSNTVLSWDDDEPHRVKTLRRNFTEKQLAEMELNEFLASDESESDEDENGDQDSSEKKKKKADMYRSLVQSGDGSVEGDEDQNMEVTFATGLEDISKKILEKKEKGSETVFEAYLRKKKEKKNARKNRSKTSSDDDSDENDGQEPLEDPDDFFEETPSAERSKKDGQGKKKRKEKTVLEKEAAEASRAELELLLADENGANKKLKGYKIKQKKAKGKKGQETPDETNLPTVDVDDPRFSALFNNPGFALDPTDPQFKRSATYYRQVAQKQQKSSNEHEDVQPMEPSIQTEDEHSVGTWQNDKHELSAMIKSLKMKSQQLPVPSTVKRKHKTHSNGPTSGKKHKLPGSDRSTKKAKLHK